MKKELLVVLVMTSICNFACADEYSDLVEYRDALREQIAAVDSEIARCEKTTKNWKTATIVGGVGAVASGVGLIIQNKKINENKEIMNGLKSDVKEANIALDFYQKAKQ